MRGDNTSAVRWVNRCRGGREPRAGALVRILGCLEIRSTWLFNAKDVCGVANVICGQPVTWGPFHHRPPTLCSLRPDI